MLEELEQREVLVLGLDGSGKSTFLRVLSGKPPLEGHVPTWGFNSVRLPTKDFEVDLLESEQNPPLPPNPAHHHLSWIHTWALCLGVAPKCISKQSIPLYEILPEFLGAQDTEQTAFQGGLQRAPLACPSLQRKPTWRTQTLAASFPYAIHQVPLKDRGTTGKCVIR